MKVFDKPPTGAAASIFRLGNRASRLIWQIFAAGQLSRRVNFSKGMQRFGIPFKSGTRGLTFGGHLNEQSEAQHLIREAIEWSNHKVSLIPVDELKARKIRGDAAFREGRYTDFFAEFRAIEEVRQQIIHESPASISNLSILMSDWTGPFGNIGLIDQFLKHNRLRLPNSQVVLVTSLESCANPTLVSLFGDTCPAIFLPKTEVSRLERELWPFREPIEVRTTGDGCLDLYKWMEVADVEWHYSGLSPLLSLPSNVEERGRKMLKSWGLRSGDWFVALHVRDESTPGRIACNAKVDSYFPAIREIIARGGHVIRLGSSDSEPLPTMKGLIDYARSIRKASWLDLFLLANCRFFIGTNAGPLGIPQIFGVPTLCTNSPHVALSMSMPQSIVIPKTLVNKDSGRVLTLAESMREPAAWTFSDESLGRVKRIDNTTTDLIGGVCEMFDIVESREDFSHNYSTLAQSIRKRANARGSIPISEHFLKSALQISESFLDS